MGRICATLGLALALAGCEQYEFPPRLLGVGTEDCPDCRELVLSESRLPFGSPTLTARFAFDDERAAVSNLRIFVTTPSGEVVNETFFVEVPNPEGEGTVMESRERPGFTCTFAIDEVELVGPETCVVTATRFRTTNSTDVAVRLEGYAEGEISATFGLRLDEVGTWRVEAEAERSTGERSNRLSATFDVVEDIVEDDPDDADTDTD